jgi:hypothetical protein
VGAQKKAQQWTKSGEIGAKKIGRTVKKKKTKTKQNKQIKAIQENTKANTGKPAKTKTKIE